MVESLKELNRICQKPSYKEVGNWMVRHFEREAALPITWLLLHTSVTANQVTLVSLIVGLIGIGLFVFPSSGIFLIGTLLLQLWYLLDHVDGQIARYRKSACLSGRFFDFLTHHVIHGVVFFSLGLYAYQAAQNFFFVIWGFVTALGMIIFNLLNDTKCKTFFEALAKLETEQVRPAEVASAALKASSPPSFSRRAFSLLHKLSEIHVLMNGLTLTALLEFFTHWPLKGRMVWMVFYGVVVPTIAIAKSAYLIAHRKIDDEFKSLFPQVDLPR